MIQPRRNEWSSCSYTTDSSIFSSSSSSSSSYIHKCTIQFNTHNWSSTLILSLLSTKSFLNLLTFTTTTTQRRRYYTFSNQTKKSTNAQTLQRKTTVLVPFFLGGGVSVNPLPISSVLVQITGAARLLYLHSCLLRSYSAWVPRRTRRVPELVWPPTSDENAGSAQLATTVRAGAGSTAWHGPIFLVFYWAARSLTNDNLG
jgi:hypothetical protein